MNNNSRKSPEVQIVLVLPDKPHMICNNFEELIEQVCNNEDIKARFDKANKGEKTLEEGFKEFLVYWQHNGILTRANFYTAKFKLEKKGTTHTKDFRLDDEKLSM